MGMWSSIYRVQEWTRFNKEYQVKLFRNGEEVDLYNPYSVSEEFVLGKNLDPIHGWFIRLFQDKYHKEDVSLIIDEAYSSRLYIDFEDIIELNNTVERVINNPSLGKDLLPYSRNREPRFGVEGSDGYVEMLQSVNDRLKNIIENYPPRDDFTEYEYDAG